MALFFHTCATRACLLLSPPRLPAEPTKSSMHAHPRPVAARRSFSWLKDFNFLEWLEGFATYTRLQFFLSSDI